MQKYFSSRYPHKTSSFYILQEYMARPFLLFTSILGLVLLWLLAQHKSILIPGLAGIFIAVILGNFLGNMFARGSYLEIGFSEEHFYLRSAYDIATKADYKLYPLAYANAVHQQNTILLNYIEQPVKLRIHEWPEWQEIWYRLNNYSIPSSAV